MPAPSRIRSCRHYLQPFNVFDNKRVLETLLLYALLSRLGNTDAQKQDCSSVRESEEIDGRISFMGNSYDPTASHSTKIVGGRDANPNEFPYHVFINVTSGPTKGMLCSGAIVSKRYVLTTAHCTYQVKSTGSISVVAGALELRNTAEAGRQKRKVKANIVHPDFYFDLNKGVSQNDIAALKVSTPFSLNEKVQTIPLAQKGTGDRATVTGWGCKSQDLYECVNNADGSLYPKNLQVLSGLTVISDERCRKKLKDIKILETHICAGGQATKGMCWGDSGSPLVENNALVGLGSFIKAVGCGCKGIPAVFTEVSEYSAWIARALAGKFDNRTKPITDRPNSTFQHCVPPSILIYLAVLCVIAIFTSRIVCC
jgi:secreted trypsin-like serine protease